MRTLDAKQAVVLLNYVAPKIHVQRRFPRLTPRFVKQYANLYPLIEKAVADYIRDIDLGSFPTKEHSFEIDEEIIDKLKS